jgi:hypothetical protein
MKLFSFLIGLLATSASFCQLLTPFELSLGTQTPAYTEIIRWWQQLDAASAKVKMFTMGITDAGFPLHLVVISEKDAYPSLATIHQKDKRVILVNNGIHPGEPDGIDASMLLARDIVNNNFKLPSNIVLAFIPVYNIGGCLNRSAFYRVDQNGPEEFGFRGNSQNLDLNRDFIKCDSKDARAFIEIFHSIDPDVFIDNHVSNGADYQHIMTLVTSQHNKLGGEMGEFMNKNFEPGIFSMMKEKGFDLIPYVNHFGETPENGWQQFWDSPRYGSGYGTLWQTFSFLPETHMLKSYKQRVEATYFLMQCFINFTSANSNTIKLLREKTRKAIQTQQEFAVSWANDPTRFQEYLFKGFESGHKNSEVSGQPRLYYDRTKPYEKMVRINNEYIPVRVVKKPVAYIIPQGWWKVTDLLKLNKVSMQPLKKDTTIEVEVCHITEYKAQSRPYEGHHLNMDIKKETTIEKVNFRKGDWYIPMNQRANRFLIEVLEPDAEDSYFAWNFFDGILGQKEGYSAYMFEDFASDYLKNHPEIKALLDQRRSTDTAFARNGSAQLNFVFLHSPYFEPAYLRYPVYRVTK